MEHRGHQVAAHAPRQVLADKAYAGAAGEGSLLHRPIKRGETSWRLDMEGSKLRKAALSKVRVCIEHCFARLKNWKVLSGLFPYHWTRLGDVVWALAVVHNVERHHASLEL
ncbi:transposase family protein [Cupriavidus necator]|uniref:transposase family protein n=1 Tax=Cupriavidus necator TaxID=106590 RepID=UPI0039C240E3